MSNNPSVTEGDIVSSTSGLFVVDACVTGLNLVYSALWREDGSHKNMGWYPPMWSIGNDYKVVGNIKQVGGKGLSQMRGDWLSGKAVV
jgi:hypothetical protein